MGIIIIIIINYYYYLQHVLQLLSTQIPVFSCLILLNLKNTIRNMSGAPCLVDLHSVLGYPNKG